MMLLRQIRQFLLTIGFVMLISTAIALTAGSRESLAAITSTPATEHQQVQIAALDQAKMMTKNVEGKVQAVIDKMTGDPKTQAQELAGETQDAIKNSIENPAYQPSGKTKKAEKKTNEAIKGIESEARDAFK